MLKPLCHVLTRHFAVLTLCLAAAVAQAPPAVIKKIVDEGNEKNSQVMAHLDHLANKIGPRLTGSERLQQAVEWARDTFKSFGIENARLVQWGEIDVGFDRGQHAGFIYYQEAGAEKSEPLVFGTNAWTAGTDGMKRGPAVLVPSADDKVEEFKSHVKGAWLVRSTQSALKTSELTQLCLDSGAFGIILNGAGMTGADLILTSGNHMTKWDKLPKVPQVNLHSAAYKSLRERLENNEKVELGFDVQNHFKQGPIPVYDVIAEIKGTEKPDEMVIVGGHIDSWDGATGTTDNGTGTCTTIEAARLLMKAGAKPKRTIRFMLWSGEEEGLLGSRAYIKDHPEETAKVSAVLVHDGGTNYVSGIGVTEPMMPYMEKVFAPVLDLDKDLPFKVRQVKALPPFIGSDQDSYTRVGVPGFFWNQAGRADYNHTHHTQYDTYDAAIPEYQRHSSVIIAVGALGIANLDVMVPRHEGMVGGGGAGGVVSRRRMLGIQPAGPEDLTLTSVTEGERADKAGLKEGDKIVKIDGAAVKTLQEFRDALNGGDPIKKIAFVRSGKEQQVSIDFTPPKAPETKPADPKDVKPAR